MKTETVVDEPAGLRARQRAARREALIDATHRLVAEHGLDGVTVDQICAAVGVSTRTFFNYFESKDDAALGIGPWSLDHAVAETFAAGGPTGDLPADLRYVIERVLDTPGIGRKRIAAVFELARREPRLLVRHLAWMEQHGAQVDELVARRVAVTGESGSDLVGKVMFFVAHMTYVRWEAEGSTGDARDHLAGVLADVGRLVSSSDPGPPSG